MANYERTFKSWMWSEVLFERMNYRDKIFYFLLHTAEESSDCSVFSFTERKIAHYMGFSDKETKKLIQNFVDKGLIHYDFETQEVLVCDYFTHNPPRGLKYEHYTKDLAKIKSKRLLELLVETSRPYVLTMSFLAALSDYNDNISPDDFDIKPTDETMESIKNAAKRGRKKASSKDDGFIEVTCEKDLPF